MILNGQQTQGNPASDENATIDAQQYLVFLNENAADDSAHRYDEKMAAELGSACIVRSGTPGSYRYQAEGGRLRAKGEDKNAASDPIAFLSQNDALQNDTLKNKNGFSFSPQPSASSPITFLSYNDVVQYCAWKNKNNSQSFSLKPSASSLSSSRSDEIDEDLKSNKLFFNLISTEISQEGFANKSALADWNKLTLAEKITVPLMFGAALASGGAYVSAYRANEARANELDDAHASFENDSRLEIRSRDNPLVDAERADTAVVDHVENSSHTSESWMVDAITGKGTEVNSFAPDQRSWMKKKIDAWRGRKDDVLSVIPGADQVAYLRDLDPKPEERSWFQKNIIYPLTNSWYRYPDVASLKTHWEAALAQHVASLPAAPNEHLETIAQLTSDLHSHREEKANHVALLHEQQKRLDDHEAALLTRAEQEQLALAQAQAQEIESSRARGERMKYLHEQMKKKVLLDLCRIKYRTLETQMESSLLEHHRTLLKLKEWEDMEARVESFEDGVGDEDHLVAQKKAKELHLLFEQHQKETGKIHELLESLRATQDSLRIAEHSIDDPLLTEHGNTPYWVEEATNGLDELAKEFNALLSQSGGATRLQAAEAQVHGHKQQRGGEIEATTLALAQAQAQEELQRHTVLGRVRLSLGGKKESKHVLTLKNSLHHEEEGLQKMKEIEKNVGTLFSKLTPILDHALTTLQDSFALVHRVEKDYIKVERFVQLMEADTGRISPRAQGLVRSVGKFYAEVLAKRDQATAYLAETSSKYYESMKPLASESETSDLGKLQKNWSDHQAGSAEIKNFLKAFEENISNPLKEGREAAITVSSEDPKTSAEALSQAQKQFYSLINQLENFVTKQKK